MFDTERAVGTIRPKWGRSKHEVGRFIRDPGNPCHRVVANRVRRPFGSGIVDFEKCLITVQELMGHADVSTTQIYTHVLSKPGMGVKSPLDG